MKEILAANLKRARGEANLTQAQVAAAMGTDQPNVARDESGRHLPGADKLEEYATLYGKTVEWFSEDHGNGRPVGPGEGPSGSRGAAKVDFTLMGRLLLKAVRAAQRSEASVPGWTRADYARAQELAIAYGVTGEDLTSCRSVGGGGLTLVPLFPYAASEALSVHPRELADNSPYSVWAAHA